MTSPSWRLLRTWLPTALGSSVLVIEIPAVAASVARSEHGAQALAALGIALSVMVVVNTGGLAMTPLVVSLAGQRAQRQLLRYGLAVGLAGSIVLALLAGSAPVFALLQLVMNIHHGLAEQVRTCLLAFAPASVAVAGRRFLHGRFIYAQHTRPITVATMVRIVCSGTTAWLLLAADPAAGAASGGFALTVGAFIEFSVLAVASRRIPPLPDAPPGRVSPLLARHAQLCASLLLNVVPAAITTAGITHSRLPGPSLVAWPALYGLMSLFTGPTLDWESVTAGALRQDPADQAPARLTRWLAAGFLGVFAVVILTPAGHAYLTGFIGVPPGPARLGLAWAPILIAAPALSVLRSYARGLVIYAGPTSWLVYASIADVVVLAALSASLSFSSLPGVACGSCAIVGGMAADVLVTALGGRPALRPAPVTPAVVSSDVP